MSGVVSVTSNRNDLGPACIASASRMLPMDRTALAPRSIGAPAGRVYRFVPVAANSYDAAFGRLVARAPATSFKPGPAGVSGQATALTDGVDRVTGAWRRAGVPGAGSGVCNRL